MTEPLINLHAPFADTPLIFIDLETTGTRATRDRVTEIAALKVIDDEIIDRFVTLIDPGVAIPPAIARLTGIDDELVAGQPHFSDIAEQLHLWLSDGSLVAHNARFDYSFLRNEFRRLGMEFSTRVICTLRLSRSLSPEHRHHNLDALMQRHGIETHARHRALGDTTALLDLWRCWARHYPVEVIEQYASKQQNNRNLPANLDADLLEEVPARPGVYLFYGHNHLPLYVGKSVNLRSRVLNHFSSDHSNDREMQISQQVQHIEWRETAGDLGAQLLEAQLVKQLSPIYNRQLRRRSTLVSWYWPAQAMNPELADGKMLGHAKHGGEAYGTFRSRKEATQALKGIAEEHKLCPQVLGIERSKGRCFAYQIKRCNGACCGVETLEEHTQRARTALERLRIAHWPWPGRVAIKETGPAGDEAYHLVDHWCYLGSFASLGEIAAQRDNVTFDVDTYKILQRFLKNDDASIEIVCLD
ncbi:exonuclease domain-containing protein [Phytohalomonas tamaricis]|uniref:exonuclease domain-containing protein n=1 Tax=Phytohalomonas tamaricis TaxID=2081032 RepID=UPI000D0BC62A|nr:exonuclease domain-containing protein [Phytohalomonas tamaricis]